jgi:Xaa-Pro aminopeptidase
MNMGHMLDPVAAGIVIGGTLIATALLSPAERAWIQSYHARVYAEVAPLCDPPVREWLRIATLPLD